MCVCVYLMSYNTTTAERRARNIAGADALAVDRRPEEASREKNNGCRRYRFILLQVGRWGVCFRGRR